MKATVKKTALRMARQSGVVNLTREGLCQAMGIIPGNFYYIMGQTFTEFIKGISDEVGPQPEYTHSNRGRLNPSLRRETLLNAAIKLASTTSYTTVTLATIAEEAGVSVSLVAKHYPSITVLHNAIMREAIKRRVLSVIAQGVVVRHPLAMDAPESIRNKALQSFNA